MPSAWVQYALLPINAIAALVAAIVTFRFILFGGSRVWVNVYSFLVSLYVFIIYALATIGSISEDDLPMYLRWIVTAIMVMIVLYYATDRRGKTCQWIKRR